MKTLIVSAICAVLTTPGFAGIAAGPAAAIAHFNQDFDTQDDARMLMPGDIGVAISTQSGLNRKIYNHFNADFDSEDNVRGLNGATYFSRQPTHGADIFGEIREAQDEDE
ncbi:hypothetical protein SAMN05444004_103271 [Jannaschia faecimaris]|uniref:Uncharacterized protein n=1 Tax=Jannaschia faecimaris TaxID=1244108 RepID=A0A1H3N4Z0_9RHOB|nr:hypothetical protein [Jannaschia faecimaris]SDY83824.1 hypothetical protein SAMN05444004_103271 [Jannaschia faecimaris]